MPQILSPLLADAVPEAVLTILKFGFLALVYLFLWQVVRVVMLELRPVSVGGRSKNSPPAVKRTKNRAARIRIIEPSAHSGETFTVDQEITIGRGGACTVVIANDEFASTIHARIFPSNEDVLVEDLGSRNGTLVNGTAIQGIVALSHGDQVQFGQTVVEVIR